MFVTLLSNSMLTLIVFLFFVLKIYLTQKNNELITSSERKVILDNQRGQSAIFVKSIDDIIETVNNKLGININDNEESIIK